MYETKIILELSSNIRNIFLAKIWLITMGNITGFYYYIYTLK